MEDAYRVVGGKPLKGEVKLSGAKNVALKTIIAALLFKNQVVLKNIPVINDVVELIHLINGLGVKASFTDTNTITIDPSTLTSNKVDMLHASKIRVSFMLFAPLLHRFKECFVPNPGGCRIGARPIDRIIAGMRSLGVSLAYNSQTGFYEASMNKVRGEFTFEKTTHTGTELLVMLAVLGTNTVVLHNAASEPEIDDLIEFLNASGAQITRNGDSVTIHGVSELTQNEPFAITNDRNELVTYAVLAIATKGDITVGDIPRSHIDEFLKMLEKTGGGCELLSDTRFRFFYKGHLSPTNIETAPHPGFMTDWQPNWAVLMTQATGESTIHERIFENRFVYVAELEKLGAKIEYISPEIENIESFYHFSVNKEKPDEQAIKIIGLTPLHNAVLRIHDLRAGACLLIAALVADGESIIKGSTILERGYENIVEKITSIGGDVSKL